MRPCERAVTQLDAVAGKRARVDQGNRTPTSPDRERGPGSRCESGAVPPPSPSTALGSRELPRPPPRPGTRIPRKGPTHAPRTTPGAVPVILLLSTSDTDLLSARASGAAWRPANPNRVTDLPALLDRADVVVVRVLGGRRYWEEGIDTVLASGKPVVALGGEQAPDAEMMELSTVPAGVAAQAHTYLAQGGPENLAQLHAFLSDTVLLTGEGFAPPVELPSWGILDRDPVRTDGPTIAVLYYRAQQLAGNTAYVEALCTADRGGRRPGPSRVLRVAAAGRARAPADAACGGRHGRHRARRRRDEAGERVGGRRRRGLGRRGAGRAGRPDPAGALPHHQPRHVGGQRRRPLAARRRDPGRRPRVRRPADHRAVLLQGVRRRRALGLRARSRARGPRRRHRRAPRPAAAHPERGQADRADAVGVPDQARPDRQRRRARHPGVRGRAAAVHGRGRLLHSGQGRSRLPRRRRAGRERADPRPHRGRRAGPRLADRGEAGRQPDPDLRGDLRALVRHAARRLPQGRRGALGSGARRAVRRHRRTATSSSPPCAAGTSC